MKLNEVIKEYCRIQALVYLSIDDPTNPSDGFCEDCPGSTNPQYFRHSGDTIKYIRQAVLEKLRADGHSIAEGFNPETGEEIIDG